MQLLKYGLFCSIERPISSYIANVTAQTEQAITLLDVKNAKRVPHNGNKQVKRNVNSKGQNNVLQKKTTAHDERNE